MDPAILLFFYAGRILEFRDYTQNSPGLNLSIRLAL